jgi:ABC-type multidrug transport system fused ATPase/permease subunit
MGSKYRLPKKYFQMKTSGTTFRILALLKDRKKKVAFLCALIAVFSAFDIAVPFITQTLIDALIAFFKEGGTAPVRVLVVSSVAIFAATVLNRVTKSTFDYSLFTFATKTEDIIKHRTFEKYLRLHVLFHHGASSGQIIGRIERGATAVFTIIYHLFGQSLLPPLVIFIGVFGSLIFKNPWIALIVALPLPVYLLAIRNLTKRIYEIERQSNDEFEAVAKEAYDVASNVLTVKKFSQEEPETRNQIRLVEKARQTQYRAERLWGVIETLQTVIAAVGRIAVIITGGLFVLRGISTVGEFVLFVTLQNMAYAPLYQLSSIFPRLRRNTARAERLFQVLDEPIKVTDKPGAKALPPLAKEIVFKDVSFRYGPDRAWALKDINVNVPVRTTVALVGRSGSGKTTFINLLLRSFDPEQGAVRIDSADIRDVTQDSLRDQIAVVPQEVDLFSRTIAENIAYGQPEVPRERIMEAAKVALAHDFIMKLEEGYDTVVGERGIKLSGGERQRVGIARAVLRDPRILILDEATSHLDTESERLIQEATAALMKNRTSFVIAHRLSTVLHADMILVFKRGEIEAAGKHEELLTISSTYKRLYSLQFANA